MARLLAHLTRSTTLVLLLASPLAAQNMNLGPWVFTQPFLTQGGPVVACASNAPAGTLHGGNVRQPVLKAVAHTKEPWFAKWGLCATTTAADAPLTVGPAKTLVELECVLYGWMRLENVPGRVSAVGFARIEDAAGKVLAEIACAKRPFIVAAVIPRTRIHDTQKTTVCLDPELKYLAHGDLNVQALIDRGIGGMQAESEFFTDDGTGLPAGLMLIVQPRGGC
jgi:hypothetical protein